MQSADLSVFETSQTRSILELQVMQLPVDGARLEQLVVRAARHHPSLVHHDDLIGMQDGRQPVGDDDLRHLAAELLDRLLDGALALRVQLAGALVEYQQASTR